MDTPRICNTMTAADVARITDPDSEEIHDLPDDVGVCVPPETHPEGVNAVRRTSITESTTEPTTRVTNREDIQVNCCPPEARASNPEEDGHGNRPLIFVTNLDDEPSMIISDQSPLHDRTITPLITDSLSSEVNISVVDITVDSSRIDLESTNLASYSEHELIAAGLFNDVDSLLDLTSKIEHWNPYSVLPIDDDDDGIR